eukprot:Rmarinus@m.22006
MSPQTGGDLPYFPLPEDDSTSAIRYRHEEVWNPLSRITFSWVLPVLKDGFHKPLDLSDLGSLPKQDRADVNSFSLSKEWDARVEAGEPSMWWSYWAAFKNPILTAGVCRLMYTLINFVPPLCVRGIVSYVSDARDGDTNGSVDDWSDMYHVFGSGYVLAVTMMIATVVSSVFKQHHLHIMLRMGLHIREALQMIIYRKALTTPQSGQSGCRGGLLMNLVSNDVQTIMLFFQVYHHGWAVFLQIAIAVLLLYDTIGVSAFLGVLVTVLVLPLQGWIARRLKVLQESKMRLTDERLKKIREFVHGVKMVKFQSWEHYFVSSIQAIRQLELVFVFRILVTRALLTFLMQALPTLVSLVAFASYALFDSNDLTASKAFGALALFNTLRAPLAQLPTFIELVVSAIVSTRRIERFLLSPTVPTADVEVDASSGGSGSGPDAGGGFLPGRRPGRERDGVNLGGVGPRLGGARVIEMHNCSFAVPNVAAHVNGVVAPSSAASVAPIENPDQSLTGEREAFLSPSKCCGAADGSVPCESHADADTVLREVSIKVPQGALTLVVGPVAVGKSQLLLAMLGELVVRGGECELGHLRHRRPVAYVPQSAWLCNGTVRENILFGRPFEEKWYWQVVGACGLLQDIAALPAADMTEIGERGVTLSGGQRHRISLARALYQDLDLYLLDDVLSALDAEMVVHVMNHAILGLLLGRGRTVVLSSNHMDLLPHATYVVSMDAGRVVAHGSYEELVKAGAVCMPNGVRTVTDAPSAPAACALTAIGDEPVWPPTTKAGRGSRCTVPPPAPGLCAGPSRCSSICSKELASLAVLRAEAQDDGRTSAPYDAVCRVRDCPLAECDGGDDGSGKGSRSVRASRCGSSKGTLMSKEERAKGALQWAIYWMYFVSCGMWRFWLVVGIMVLARGAAVGSDYWLAEWSDSARGGRDDDDDDETEETPDVLGDHGVFGGQGEGGGSETSSAVLLKMAAVGTLRLLSLGWRRDTLSNEGLGFGEEGDDVVDSGPWVHAETETEEDDDDDDLAYYLTGYVILTALALGLALGTYLATAIAGYNAAKSLHETMLQRVAVLPMSFFDTTPAGRILNRFSSDTDIVDTKLSETLQDFFFYILQLISTLSLFALFLPKIMLFIIPITALYLWTMHFVRPSARELQRLDNISRSPVFAHMSETVSGLAVVRAFRVQLRFLQRALNAIDDNAIAYLFVNVVNRWLGLRLEALSALVVFAIAIGCVMLATSVRPGFVGLLLNYTLQVTMLLTQLVRASIESEMQATSVQRIGYYSALPPEPLVASVNLDGPGGPGSGGSALRKRGRGSNDGQPASSNHHAEGEDDEGYGSEEPDGDVRVERIGTAGLTGEGTVGTVVLPSSSWPSRGRIHVDRLTARYRPELPAVLHDISLDIPAGHKVGICGRTGAGKSSFVLALTRMLQYTSGRIVIDGLDISRVPYTDLRPRMSIIPQDPALFSGSVRWNLDPTGQLPDFALWEALERVQLKGFISGLRLPVGQNKLDAVLDEGGREFSQGQRQLFCLARALLSEASIVVLDEATSSIDTQTDRAIQQVIRRTFRDRTVLTIAHRISSILDYDLIVVLQEGRVVELGAPSMLLRENPEGPFASLAGTSGKLERRSGCCQADAESW